VDKLGKGSFGYVVLAQLKNVRAPKFESEIKSLDNQQSNKRMGNEEEKKKEDRYGSHFKN
jgi:hypothetical protein